MGTAAAAGGAEFTDVAAGTVRALDGKDVVVIGDTAVRGGDASVGGGGQGREEDER